MDPAVPALVTERLQFNPRLREKFLFSATNEAIGFPNGTDTHSFGLKLSAKARSQTKQLAPTPFIMKLNRTSHSSVRTGGWTIIELMLVLGVIGVLVAIALPKYTDYRERVKQSQAVADIGVLQVLISGYQLNAGAYPASLADVGNDGKLDPWGNAYVYVDLTTTKGHGKARKDHKLNPINSDFDLYSMGKNGVSKTQLTQKDSLDDIVRARDGKYIGLARDFSP
jgi:general secretion pathway protein G